MKSDGGRRVFLAALLLCFGVLTFFYARRSTDLMMAIEHQFPRRNDSLYLTVQDDGVVAVEGEGVLYGTDMAALLRSAQLREDSVTDIIIGDGITEIGYNAFYDCDNLQTLKLGARVARVSAGGLKQCPELKYLYYPAGLRDVGEDFLFQCKSCRIVTPVLASELPTFANVAKKKRVLERIDAYEALAEAVEEQKLPRLSPAVKRWWEGA